MRETDCKVVRGLLNFSRFIPVPPSPPQNLAIDLILPQQPSSTKNSNLNWTAISLAPTVRYCYVRTSMFSHIYTVCFPFSSAADCGLMLAMNQVSSYVMAFETSAQFKSQESSIRGLRASNNLFGNRKL